MWTTWGPGEVYCIQWNPLMWSPWRPGEVYCIQWNPLMWSPWRPGEVYCTVEALYCGHLGDLVKCTVYSGTPLMWTTWGPGEVYCIQWNPSNVDNLEAW